MWIARNENGDLEMFKSKPVRHTLVIEYEKTYKSGKWIIKEETLEHTFYFPGNSIDSSLFPDLKWEDEPLEVELIIKSNG